MICNSMMRDIIEHIEINDIHQNSNYPIWMEVCSDGRPFWGTGNFCGLKKRVVNGQDLMSLEWDGNEVYISNSDDIIALVAYSIGIANAWEQQMEREYSNVPFDIIMSVDDGSEVGDPSVTLRFWAVRNSEHYVMPSIDNLEQFSQPVMMLQVNAEKV